MRLACYWWVVAGGELRLEVSIPSLPSRDEVHLLAPSAIVCIVSASFRALALSHAADGGFHAMCSSCVLVQPA